MCISNYLPAFITNYIRKREIIKNRLIIDYIPEPADFTISTAEEAIECFRYAWSEKTINIQERVYVIFLNNACRPIGAPKCFHKGGVCETVIDTRIIFSTALACLASGIIIAHNHPSGDITPSDIDVELTVEIQKICNYHKIGFFDHLIISKTDFFSFREAGMID